jgi:hypothetical protein
MVCLAAKRHKNVNNIKNSSRTLEFNHEQISFSAMIKVSSFHGQGPSGPDVIGLVASYLGAQVAELGADRTHSDNASSLKITLAIVQGSVLLQDMCTQNLLTDGGEKDWYAYPESIARCLPIPGVDVLNPTTFSFGSSVLTISNVVDRQK